MTAASSKEGYYGEPQGEPAIVLRGEVIRFMTPEHRERIANSLGILIGARAEVIHDPADQPESSGAPDEPPLREQECNEDNKLIPPFSAVIRHPRNWGYPSDGVAEFIRTVTRQHPESLQNESMTKRAVAAVAVAGSRASTSDTKLDRYFDFHYEGTPVEPHYRPVAAITFKNPSAFLDSQANVHELVHNLGPKGVEALAELALVVTGTVKPQRQVP